MHLQRERKKRKECIRQGKHSGWDVFASLMKCARCAHVAICAASEQEKAKDFFFFFLRNMAKNSERKTGSDEDNHRRGNQ